MSSIEKYIDKLGKEGNGQDDKEVPGEKFANGQSRGGRIQEKKSYENNSTNAGHVTINLAKLQASGILTPDQTSGRLVDEFRAIKRPILNQAFNSQLPSEGNNNLVMVTSSFPNEGKTFNSISLAMSIVMEMDYTVLLVEADLAKPSILRYMGIDDPSKGLTSLLNGDETNLSNVILQTNISKLNLLPAGGSHANSYELIASSGMKNLVKELSSRYDDRVIIFDSPPLLSCNDAVVLSNLVGQTILIVESGKTERSAIIDAIGRLESNQNIGVVLNKNIGGAKSTYGYYGS